MLFANSPHACTYRVRIIADDGRCYIARVKGFRVGRFALRTATEGMLVPFVLPPGVRPARAWSVDHVPSGSAVADFDTEELALCFVDYLSAACERDPKSRDPERAWNQVGPSLWGWIDYARLSGDVVRPREFARGEFGVRARGI